MISNIRKFSTVPIKKIVEQHIDDRRKRLVIEEIR